jgi:2-polyprenyl-3-methyl-5-hydroxy-6-metoxy-1,4-benzoquinol methylase
MAELDFLQRAELTELMDGPCSYEELRDCLRDIARVNRLTMAYRPTIQWLESMAASASPSGPLCIVDVGCGYGDMLRRIERWAAQRGLSVKLIGVDLNADAIRAACESTAPASAIEWIAGDVYSCVAAAQADVVISSLLTHHLSEAEIIQFLEWMERTARRGWFVNDLHRQKVPYYAFRAMAAVAGWHPFVSNDGPVSIRRSFVPEDWERMLAAAGVDPDAIRVTQHRPARLCVGRLKLAEAGRDQ